MTSFASDDITRISYFIFAVQRLNGIAHVVSTWMTSGALTAWDGKPARFADCEAAALSYFDAGAGQERTRQDYLAALQAARQLDQSLADFLARRAQGDLDALLGNASEALTLFAGTIDQLSGYPGADTEARALRAQASQCDSLRKPS